MRLFKILLENDTVSDRIDRILDWSNEKNIKIPDEALKEYIEFNNKYLHVIESLVEKINNQTYTYGANIPMYQVMTMTDLHKGNDEPTDIEIYKVNTYVTYARTHIAQIPNFSISDRYDFFYLDSNNSQEITMKEMLDLYTKGAIFAELGPIGMSVDDLKNLIENL